MSVTPKNKTPTAGKSLRFIDLFSGLGGFHVGLTRLGHRCVFACELDDELRRIYSKNFNCEPASDIRKVKTSDIPPFDVLCAGFPCQPFSKAGEQLGTYCPESGDLFHDHVVRILKYHQPRFLLLENVPNLLRHHGGDTWARMEATLRRLGYQVEKRLLSPHKFGVPQIRDRLFVVASKDGLDDFLWPEGDGSVPSLRTVLDPPAPGARQLSQAALDCLAVWQDFLNRSAHLEQLPSFPIWSMEFGATYPYEHVTPSKLSSHRLGQHLGAFGQPLCGLPRDKKIELLPPYARSEEQSFPAWKVDFIRQNRTFYSQNKKWIDPWLPSIRRFPNSLQKFEWNCKGEARDVWSTIIQFRASGVRVKRPSTAPSLVAMTTTQVPIIGWERRFMTPLECARLQSLDSLAELPSTSTRAFKALGNAVNAKLVELVAGKLLSTGKVTSSPKTAIAAA